MSGVDEQFIPNCPDCEKVVGKTNYWSLRKNGVSMIFLDLKGSEGHECIKTNKIVDSRVCIEYSLLQEISFIGIDSVACNRGAHTFSKGTYIFERVLRMIKSIYAIEGVRYE